jgi:hypothetical protein
MNLDWICFHSVLRLLKHPAASVAAIGFMVWHVEPILKVLEISFDSYDLLIDGQSSEWNATRSALLFAPPVPILVFIFFFGAVLSPCTGTVEKTVMI